MNSVIVDTSVWSVILRRKQPEKVYQEELDDIMDADRLIVIGPIIQELLSGISQQDQFKKLSHTMSFFEAVGVEMSDYIFAAQFFNICRMKGIQGSHNDFLICAVANRLDALIWTLDQDFTSFKELIPIQLYQI